MQDGDNIDSKHIQKYDGKAAVMEEQLIVGDNSLEMDLEEIGNDTGQPEDDILHCDNIRPRSDSVDSDLVGLAELGLLATLADAETRKRIMAEDCDLSHIDMTRVEDSCSDEDREADDDDNMSSCCSDSADFKEWTTLRPDEENMDSSKIAALSSAFSSYISSPKHNKQRKPRQNTSQQDDIDPNMGQFLLPLVTEQLPVQDVNPSVETDHSVIEVLAAEAKRFKKAGDEMSALAWRILGEYHALENTCKSGANSAEGAASLEEDDEERQQVMQLISKCINDDETLVIFQELNKEIQDREGETGNNQAQGMFSKLLQEDTIVHCLNNLESETVDKLKKFSDTRLVKSVLRCINGEKTTPTNDTESNNVPNSTEASNAQDGEGDGQKQPDQEKETASLNVMNKTFKFLENSPLRSTLEQYMMMQIASREAEAEQNQRLLRELGGITSNNASILSSSAVAGNGVNFSSSNPEEPAQRIFDCDTVNTTSRFIELDDSPDGGNADKTLCPGGCGNLRHCSRYTNNGANHSPSKSVSSPSHPLTVEEDEGIVEEIDMGSEEDRDEDETGTDKDNVAASEDAEIGRLVDAQSGWWELRALLCAVWRAADVGSLACKSVAVATVPPCHCCRCSHPMLRKLPSELDSSTVESLCQCQQQSVQYPNQPRERCRSCLTDNERLMRQVWGGKVVTKVPAECCCQERRSTRTHHSCTVRLFFRDPAIAPVDFDLSKTEFEKHDLEVDEENSKFLKECHRRYLEGEDDISRGDEDVVPLCDRCRCKCGRAKFYCPKVRDRTIKQNIDNFTRLAPQLLILRLDALCSALCAWHGAHLSRILAGGAVMTFLKELWRRAAAMRNGGIALSGILGPTRRRLATVCGRLLAPHQYLSGVYRGWADRAAATRVVHLSMLQLLGKAPPQTVEALHSFSSLLSMMNEAETLRGDVTTFLGNYHQYERDEFLISLRLRLMLAQRKNLAIARFLGLLGDDPCELKGDKDCESSIVAQRLSECLPTDPAELNEFKRIVQAMLLYHSSGGGISQLPTKANRILGGDGLLHKENNQGKRCLELTANSSASAAVKSDDNVSPNECSSPYHHSSNHHANSIEGEGVAHSNDCVDANARSVRCDDVSENNQTCDGSSKKCKGDRLHSAAVMKRRQELEKEFVQREKSRIINNFVNALNSTHYKNDMLGSSALFQDLKTSSETTNRPRPVKRKFKTNDTSEETNNVSGDSSQASVTFRMKPGCHKVGIKPNRISKSAKGRYVKSIRRASIGHMSEVVRKEQTPVMKTIASSPKAVRTLTKRGRSVSLYSETRRYLESAIREYESVCPMNTVSVSGSDNVLRWYSMPDMTSSRDSDSDSSICSAADAFTSLKIDDDVNKLDQSKLNEYRQKQTKELNSNLKGLTSKLIPELFVPPPSSVDPFIDIQLKKDFDVYVKDNDESPSTPGFNENVLEKLRKPVFDNETPEQRYLRMQMCECLEKMELLGLEDQEQQNKAVAERRDNEDDDNVPSPPLELSPTTEIIDLNINLDSKNKRRLLSLNQTLMAGKTSDVNSLLCSTNDIMTQEKNILKDFIDYEIGSKKDSDLALDDLKITEALPFLEISDETNEKQQKDKLNMEIHLTSERESNEKEAVEIKISSHLNDIIREHGIESDSLKQLLDPMNLIKTFGSKNLWNITDDLSLLTPETIKQLKEVRQARIKKQTCGKRKNTKKNSECSSNNTKGFSDKAQFQATMMEDPTKEEIMTEMLGHRHRKKGFKNAKEFQAKLFTASLQVVMRKVLQVLMPCEEDVEFENLRKSGQFGGPYDVKVGNQIDGCNIDDYWDGIKSQFSSWRAFTLEQYWNLPENCRNPTYSVDNYVKDDDATKYDGECLRCKPPEAIKPKAVEAVSTAPPSQDEQKKRIIKKSVASKVITLDPAKAKSYLTPGEHALFVERLQAVNKDYVDKLLKQNLTGEDWIFAMNELQNLERKLKSAVKEKSSNSSSNSTGSNKMSEETREAELLAGRGLSKLINQFSKKTKDTKQDLNTKSTKSSTLMDASKTDKSKAATVVPAPPNQSSKTDHTVSSTVETKHKEDDKKADMSDKSNKECLFNKSADEAKSICTHPIGLQNDNCKNGLQADCPTCMEHAADIHECEVSACGATSTDHTCECCRGCQPGHTKQPDSSEGKLNCVQQKHEGDVTGNNATSQDKVNTGDKMEVDPTICQTEGKDGATKIKTWGTFYEGYRRGQEWTRKFLEEQNNSPSHNSTATKKEQPATTVTGGNTAVDSASSQVVAKVTSTTEGAASNVKVGNTASCAHAPSNGNAVCKGEHHHHHHGHQHTCNNANQRDVEACANHNPSDSTNRCSQHAASARGAGTNNASNNSANSTGNGSGAGGSDQPCNCCYCTVFGHAPPVTTPVSKNFNETRERLRSILNRKKQRCRPGSSISSQGGDSDTGDAKTNGKGEETPSIIPITPTVKPDPLPTSTMPKQRPTQPVAAVPQSESNRSTCPQSKPQQQQVPVKTVQTTNVKPTQAANVKSVQIFKPSNQIQQQTVKTPSDVQKPNLPLKLKIKQGDGQIAIQDMIKKEAETVKNTPKDVAKSAVSKDVKNIQNVATAKKATDVTKITLNEAIKNLNQIDPGVVKVGDKKPAPASIVVKREKSDALQKQTDSVVKDGGVIHKRDQESEVDEQNSRNAKKHRMAAAVNESKGIQTDKPRSQSLQPTGNPQVHHGGNIQKTGPQPLQTQQQAKRGMEQNRAKGSGSARPPEIVHSASNTTSRDCSVFSTSTVCSGCSVDPRDLDMLMEFIEGPGSVMDKIKKKAKKARQKAKKMVEKLEVKLSKFEVKAAQLRAESNKLDKLLVATVGKKKKPNKKGKKKGENEVEDESVVALRRTAREYRDRAAQAEKELEDGRRMLNRVAKALLLIGSTEDISQLPEIIAVQQQVSLMSSLEEKEELEPASNILPQHLQELRQMANNNFNNTNNTKQQQNQVVDNSRSPSLDQILANSLQRQNGTNGKPPSQCMVTIKRVMMPESGEPSVTITPKGSDKPIYTFQNHAASMSQQAQQQHQQHEQIQSKKKSQPPTWESTLAQINSLSQGKRKKEINEKTKKADVQQETEKKQIRQQQQQQSGKNQKTVQQSNAATNSNDKTTTSVNSSLYPSRSTSTVSELSSVDMNTAPSKKQRKLLAKKLKQEEEENERLRLEAERLAAQKGGNKKNKGVKHIKEETEEDHDPEKIVLSMRQLKTAVERALEAMDSDGGGQKLPGKGKLKDNAKEFIEKVVSKVEETKKATAAQSNTSGKRVDKVVDISEVVLGSFSGKIASATNKQQNQSQKNNQQMAKNATQKQNINQQQGGSQQQAGVKKQKQKDAGANNEGLKVVSGKGAINATTKKNNNGKKNQSQNQATTSVHHRSTPLENVVQHNRGTPQQQQQQVLLTNHMMPGVGGLGYHQGQFPGHHANQQQHQQQHHRQLNANYMDKINLNSDITIQLANENENNGCGGAMNDMNIKPGGPVSCSIMEQLRNGVQVPNLKLPPGITLTWVDPNKKQPDPTPKAAIPVVKLSSVAPEYRPTPPVVQPPPLIMVDTKNIPQNRDPKTQVAQSAQVPNQPQDSSNKSKSKKSKKKCKKPPANLIQPSETSTHSHQRVEEQQQPMMVTLRNPMFHPTLPSVSLSSVQSGKRVSESIPIPDPIPMPPNSCQATITPTSNGMFTIRNPLMSMVHQQNMMAMKEAPVPSANAPVVLMSSTGSVLATDINQMKDHSVNVELAGRIADMGLKNNNCNPPNVNHQQMTPPHMHQNKDDSGKMTTNANSDYLTQNLSFTPNKETRAYSLFKSEHGDISSPSNNVINQHCQENNVCPSPIGSKTNRVPPPTPMSAARQLDFNSTKQQLGNVAMSGWQDCPLPVGTQSRKSEDMSSDSGIDGGPPGFYTPFGQADSDKLFGSLLFQNSARDEHLQQTMWSAANTHEDQLLRNQSYFPKMDLLPNSVEIGLVSHNENKQGLQSMNNGGNREYRTQPTPVGYGAKNNSLWNGPYSNNYPQSQSDFPQPTPAGSGFYQSSTNNANSYGQNFPTSINQNYSQIRSSHSSSSSGLMTSSVISSGTNSVYDSVSNSSSNSPADATNQEPSTDVTNITNATIQQSSPDGRNYTDFSPYVSMLPQPQGLNNSDNNFNAFGRVTDSPGTAERMAELLAANRDRLNELGWYTMGNQNVNQRSTADVFNQLRISDEQNYNNMSQQSSRLNTALSYYNTQRMQNTATANNFSPTSSGNTEAFRQTNAAKLNVDSLQLSDDTSLSTKYAPYGAIGQGKQQAIPVVDEGQTIKNLGAIGSHRSGAAPNGMRQEEYYPGDSRSIFAPDQTISDLSELESAERDIESFKRFHFYFEPPKNKPKITLNLKDIKTRDKM